MSIEISEFDQTGKNRSIQYYDEKLELAHKLGYPNIASSFLGEYLKHKSARRAAKVLRITSAGLIYRLKQIPGVKILPRGGDNHPKLTLSKLRDGRCPVKYCNGDHGRKTILKNQPDGKLICPKCGGIWDNLIGENK